MHAVIHTQIALAVQHVVRVLHLCASSFYRVTDTRSLLYKFKHFSKLLLNHKFLKQKFPS